MPEPARLTLRIHGADANFVVHPANRLELIAGVGYLRIQEELEAHVAIGDFCDSLCGVDDEYHTWTTDNRMVGPQVGARVGFVDGDRFTLTGEVKAGLMFNSIAATVLIDRPGAFDLTGADLLHTGSLLLAGAIAAGFQLTDAFSLTLGYQALWLNRTGLAAYQVAGTGNFAIPGPDTIPLDHRHLAVPHPWRQFRAEPPVLSRQAHRIRVNESPPALPAGGPPT